MNKKKLLKQCFENPKNIKFADFVGLVESFGFSLARISGSHHIFKNPDLGVLINIQDAKGEAKSYQIRQFLKIVEKENLKFEDES